MRGEFRLASGLVVPNNITSYGHAMILSAAIRGIQPVQFLVALGSGVYTPSMAIGDFTEPTLTNGYARQPLNQNQADWTSGALNGEQFVESKDLIWTATGDFSAPFDRMALLNGAGSLVFALSGALSTPRLITPATPAQDRTLRYRIYLGQ